ncbi:MAG: FtsX-like permease family protein, partial [bacterium]|nr:FtsX-like permease family protein [bacterium]
RKDVILQFFGESILLSFMALVFALVMAVFMLPIFNNLFLKDLPLSLLLQGNILPVLIVITILTGLAGGSYPAFFLSSFKPDRVLRGNLKSGSRNTIFRKVLVVFQFVLSLFLIIGTSVIYKQIDFIKAKSLGYDKEHVVCIPLRAGSAQYYNALKNSLQSNTKILNVTGVHQRPTQLSSNSTGGEWDGQDSENEVLIGAGFVDYDYIETMKIDFLEGRDFSEEFPSDQDKNFIVNEEMLRLMGVDQGVGKRLKFWGREGNIVGVVRNFHFLPLNRPIGPFVLILNPGGIHFLVARIYHEDIPSTINFIRETWKQVIPAYPFEYNFLNADFDRMYRSVERIANILKSFAILAILIACMGLYGLASFIAEQRTKEVGIRKTLGATIPNLINLLTKEFLTLIMISVIGAWPVSYFVMNKWLQDYAYRTDMTIWTLLFPALIALVLTIITVSYQAIKAALTNPVNSLRYE